MTDLISIIMPIYNMEKYVGEAIESVINQKYKLWELIVVNDGSSDNSKNIIHSFNDKRIKYYEQSNKGVSSARNVALNHVNGDYFCFLDADDIYTEDSLSSRLVVFKDESNLTFVDGQVEVRNIYNNKYLRTYIPKFKGNPLPQYLRLNDECFFGPSCMIKRNPKVNYFFDENITHGEDLLFYITYIKDGLYSYTSDLIMIYRSGNKSAMTDLRGLEKGYYYIYTKLKDSSYVTYNDLQIFHKKISSIMFKSYLRCARLISAFKIIYRYLNK